MGPMVWGGIRFPPMRGRRVPWPTRSTTALFVRRREASFDEVAADEFADATQTDATDWVFPIRDGVEVRSGDRPDAAVIETLGLYLVRVIPDDSPANAVLSVIKVLTPSGKVGFVPLDSVLPIGGEQMCYVKEPSGWKIAG